MLFNNPNYFVQDWHFELKIYILNITLIQKKSHK